MDGGLIKIICAAKCQLGIFTQIHSSRGIGGPAGAVGIIIELVLILHHRAHAHCGIFADRRGQVHFGAQIVIAAKPKRALKLKFLQRPLAHKVDTASRIA